MTYLATKPTVSVTSIERPLITIEFAPKIHKDETEFTYEHPQFVFGDRVTIGGTSFHYPPVIFTVCALELIESKTQSGRLLSQPHWKYKVTNGQVSYWKDETALIRYQDKSSPSTCLTCDRFKNFLDFAKTDHTKTNDCIINGALDKNNEALTTEVIELDRDGYPMEEVEPTGYFSTDFVTNSVEPF